MWGLRSLAFAALGFHALNPSLSMIATALIFVVMLAPGVRARRNATAG